MNKDQSSLTALQVNGLVDLDSVFAALMSAATIGIFTFGLTLHRRREYLTLRALGLSARNLFALVVGEAALVVLGGLLAGVPAGIGTGLLLVRILRSLFILPPTTTVPIDRLVTVAALPVLAALLCAVAATWTLRRLRPAEILRDV